MTGTRSILFVKLQENGIVQEFPFTGIVQVVGAATSVALNIVAAKAFDGFTNEGAQRYEMTARALMIPIAIPSLTRFVINFFIEVILPYNNVRKQSRQHRAHKSKPLRSS